MIMRKIVSVILVSAFLSIASYAFAADTTPPTGTISIFNGAAYTNKATVTLNLSATDAGSSVTQMKFSNNNILWSLPQSYSTTKSWILESPTRGGVKSIYVKYKDASGNWSAPYTDTIILDTRAPTGSVSINSGSQYTKSVSVTLKLSMTDASIRVPAGSQMQFSNNNSTWSAAEAYASTKSWTLTTGDGTKTAYVKYKDGAGNWSSVYSDTITLDTVAPAKPSINAVMTPTGTLSQTITGTKTTDASSIIVTCTTATVGAVTYPTSATWSCALTNLASGSNAIAVKARDAAGNESLAATATIVSDTVPPSGSISINNGSQYANSTSAMLSLSAIDSVSGVTHMQLSNNGTTWSAAETYVTTKSWTLTSGNGTKAVYVKYKDAAVNWSIAFTDTIILDTSLPPSILTSSLPNGIAGESCRESLNAIDGTKPYVWSISTGSLPGGLSINSSTGEIYGTPNTAGVCSFTVKLTDARSRIATRALSLTILPAFPAITDADLLDQTEAKSALYFYNEAISNGFVKDADYKDFSSVGATGFGLAALCVTAERYQTTPAWTVTPAQVRARVNQILDNCLIYQCRQAQAGNDYGVAGFLFHFINANGTRQGTCEVSTVDMSLFLAGAITAGEYFGGEVKTKADQIYKNMNWSYFLNTSKKQFSHGWFPDSGVMPGTWDRPSDETMLVSLLAIGANPANMDILNTMYSWPRTLRGYGGYQVVNSYFGSLFTYIFANCFFDFEKLGPDNPAYIGSTAASVNWWVNSVNAAKANRQFCIDNADDFASYGADSWGITICEYPNGQYSDFLGAQPCEKDGGVACHDGTIAPYGAISAMPFMRAAPTEALGTNLAFKALKNYYQKYYHHLWGKYGPKDSFNHNREFSNAYLGIDVGPQVLMIENYRSGLLWKNFMKNAKILAAALKIFGDDFLPEPTTIYVNATNAGDPDQDGSQAHPFSSIQRGINESSSNSAIIIAPGRYEEALNILSKIKLVIKGTLTSRGDPCNFQMNTVISNTGYDSAAVTISGSQDIVIDSIIINGDGEHNSNTIGGISDTNSATITIKNTIIQDTGNQESWIDGRGIGGISSINSMNVTIIDNVIRNNHGCKSAGIYVVNESAQGEATILRNDVFGNYAYSGSGGIYVAGITNVSIKNNHVYGSRSIWYGPGNAEIPGGLTVYGAKGGVISNNLIGRTQLDNDHGYNYGGDGLNSYDSNVMIVNNVIESAGIGASGGSPVVKHNMVNGYCGSYWEDPLFIARDNGDGDPHNDDYHLQPFSFLINAGHPDPKFNDKDGTRNDIGLYGGPDAAVPAPKVLAVPQDYATIQGAIDAAAKGDVVKVSAGIYTESVILNKSGIVLIGDNRNSIIKANSGLAAVYCENINNDMTLISGFTLQGLYGVRCSGNISSLRIEDSNIRVADNGFIDYGYGVYMEDGASSVIMGNNIINCGRAIHGCGNNDARIIENNIDNCRMQGGGGIFFKDATAKVVMIRGNNISRCRDGAISFRNGAGGTILNNWITNNDASSGTAIIECTDSYVTLFNNFIGYNSASGDGNCGFVGRIISNYYTCAYLSNNIFYRNIGTNSPSAGSAISLYGIRSQSSSIVNNIFVENSNAAAVIFSDSAISSVTNNDIWNNTCQTDAINVTAYECISVDPLFVSVTDFHLQSGSPCINAGHDSYDRDIDGTRSDMGIYGGPYPMPEGN